MPSQSDYYVSPRLMKELESVQSRIESDLLTSDITPENVDWFRYRGFKTAVDLVRNLSFNTYEPEEEAAGAFKHILRHTKMVDQPTMPEED